MEALKERGLLLQNAPHLVHDLRFVVPNYDWWEAPFYGLGLKLYNLLAGKYGFGTSRILSKEETLERLPTIKTGGPARRRRSTSTDNSTMRGCSSTWWPPPSSRARRC